MNLGGKKINLKNVQNEKNVLILIALYTYIQDTVYIYTRYIHVYTGKDNIYHLGWLRSV